MKKFADCIIPDAELDAYLADKLTTRPDYGEHEPKVEDPNDVLNRWRAAQEAEKKNREANNKSAGRGLKK